MSDLEEQARDLTDELHYWAELMKVPMNEINNKAMKLVEFTLSHPDEELKNVVDFAKATFFTDKPNFGALGILCTNPSAM